MNALIRRGLVALSADPITNGHIDLIRRSAERCKELLVLVADNDRKKGSYTYQLDERRAMAERAVAEAGVPNVRVIGSAGLLVDIYLREACDRLFRGVRNAKDIDFEEEQHKLNELILLSLKVEFLQAAESLQFVSSTMVKSFVDLALDVDRFVPMFVKQSLEERRMGQYRIAVTGGIAVGKSWVAKELARQSNEVGIKALHVNVDQLLRDAYDEKSPGAQDVRDELSRMFGSQVLSADMLTVDRKCMAEILFRADAEAAREAVTKLTMPHVARMYRSAIAGVKGLVIVEWAQIAEMDMGPWTNNNVIVVDSPDRPTFLKQRNVDPERIKVMDTIQWPVMRKVRAFESRADRDHNGTVFCHTNVRHSTEEYSRRDVAELFGSVRAIFPGLSAAKT